MSQKNSHFKYKKGLIRYLLCIKPIFTGSPDIFSYHFVVVLDCHFNHLQYAYQYYPLNKSFILSSSYFLDGASGGVVLVKEILSPSISTYLSHLK